MAFRRVSRFHSLRIPILILPLIFLFIVSPEKPSQRDIQREIHLLHAHVPVLHAKKALSTLPTSVRHTEHSGIPPSNLPSHHPQYLYLNYLRSRTTITPRWPNHHSLPVHRLRTYGPAFSSIIISNKLKAIYIPVFKVSTTTVMHLLAYLSENELLQPYFNTSRVGKFLHDMKYWPSSSICNKSADFISQRLNDPSYLKFGFVRNPYTRLLSAYQDKILLAPERLYKEQIRCLFHHNQTLFNHHLEHKPTFSEFLSAVDNVLSQPRTKSEDLDSPDAYESNLSRRDVHWRPQVELLHPDLIHLDYVGKFENFESDVQLVLNWMYLHTDKRWKSVQLNRRLSEHRSIGLDVFRENEQLRELVKKIYREDFETFHYSTEIPQASKKLRV